MKTIILPGYSLHNKEWAEEVGGTVHYWRHWSKGGSFSLGYEVGKILEEVKTDKVNLIAKSVGTMVAMSILQKIPGQVKKIILCGIPSVSEERLELFQTALKNFPPENIIVFQNSHDPFATFTEVKRFMEKINPQIKVMEKPAETHDYPYFADFEKFLD